MCKTFRPVLDFQFSFWHAWQFLGWYREFCSQSRIVNIWIVFSFSIVVFSAIWVLKEPEMKRICKNFCSFYQKFLRTLTLFSQLPLKKITFFFCFAISFRKKYWNLLMLEFFKWFDFCGLIFKFNINLIVKRKPWSKKTQKRGKMYLVIEISKLRLVL